MFSSTQTANHVETRIITRRKLKLQTVVKKVTLGLYNEGEE